MLNDGDARRLTEAQQEISILIQMNEIERKVLSAISEGLNMCDMEKLPDEVANNVKSNHPDWDLYNEDNQNITQISW